MFWAVLGLVGVGLVFTFTGVVMSAAPRHAVNTSTVMLVGAACSVAISLAMLRCYPPVPWGSAFAVRAVILYALTGVLNFLMCQAIAAAMRTGPNSIVWTMAQSGMVLTFLYGVLFQHDIMNAWRGCGMALLVAALVCMGAARGSDAGEGARRPGHWLVWAVLAFLLCGANQTTNTIPSNDPEVQRHFNYAARNLSLAGATFLAASVWNLLASPRHCWTSLARELRSPWLWAFVVAMQSFSLICTYVLQYRCIDVLARHHTAAIAYPLMVSSCLIGFACYSLLVLRERLSRLQAAGLLASLAGILLVCVK